MAVQARHQAHHHHHHTQASFPHGLHSFSPLSMDEHGDCAPAAVAGIGSVVFCDVPRGMLTSNATNGGYGFVPRKRARVEAAGFLEDQRVAMMPAAQQGIVPVGGDGQLGRAVGSGAASTSGRMASGTGGLSQGILSQLYHHGVEIDALVRLEAERMRAGLEDARRRHVRALVAAAERAAAGRLRAADADLERARRLNAELEEKLRQMSAEGQAWMGVAKSNEAVAAGLRATLDQLLQSPCAAAGDAEDARSCCFETPADDDDAASRAVAAACKACLEAEACVLLLPCRHLCLCRACDAAVDTCPVCAATKNATLHVLLS